MSENTEIVREDLPKLIRFTIRTTKHSTGKTIESICDIREDLDLRTQAHALSELVLLHAKLLAREGPVSIDGKVGD